MKKIILILLFTIFSFANVNEVFACSCRQSVPLCEEFGNAKAIFVGKVIEEKSAEKLSEMITDSRQDNSFIFNVKQNYLGTEANKNITIYTGFGSGDCGYPFQKGEEYLVYAYEFNGKLKTNICTRTKLVSNVKNDFEELKKLSLNFGAKISGTATLYAKSSLEKDSIIPMKNLKLQIEQLDGEKKSFEVLTDNSGNYSVAGLPTGKYKIIPSLPENLTTDEYQTADFSLNDKGCAAKDFRIKNDSRLSLKVVDSNGNPVKDIWVEIVPVGIVPQSFGAEEFGVTNPQGELIQHNIPPGKYVISINKYHSPSAKNPYPSVFYPNTSDKNKAEIIYIKIGSKIENLIFKLPPTIPMTEIRGSVVWENGKPAENAFVEISDFESSQIISTATTDGNGNFILKGFSSKKYTISASADAVINEKLVDFDANEFIFSLNEKSPKIRLVLRKKID